jgi:hypothetical protein
MTRLNKIQTQSCSGREGIVVGESPRSNRSLRMDDSQQYVQNEQIAAAKVQAPNASRSPSMLSGCSWHASKPKGDATRAVQKLRMMCSTKPKPAA